MMPLDIVQELAQFGAAGLMGMLWIWERRLSRQREQQLVEAHTRLMENRLHLKALVKLVRRNTEAFDRFAQMHTHLCQLLEEIRHAERTFRDDSLD
jgi:hypothetical protein